MSYLAFMGLDFPIGTLPQWVIVINETVHALPLAQLLEQWLEWRQGLVSEDLSARLCFEQVPEEASDIRHGPFALLGVTETARVIQVGPVRLSSLRALAIDSAVGLYVQLEL